MATRMMERPKKEKKVRVKSTAVKPKKSEDVSVMEDAVVDGKIVVPVDTVLLTVRHYSNEVQRCICVIKKIEDDLVSCWDETMEYWWCFNPSQVEKHNIIIKVKKKAE